MASRNLNTLQDLGEAGQLVNDFKFAKNAYFALKHKQLDLLAKDLESVEDDYWEDESFENEIKIFEERKKLYGETQELYKALKTKLKDDPSAHPNGG